MKILFVIDSMSGGGAARVTSVLINELLFKGYQVALATNLSFSSCVYSLNSNATLFNIYGQNPKNKFIKLWDRIIRLQKVIKQYKPDIIIGEQENAILYARMATVFSRIPIIGHRHNTFKILGLSTLQKLIFNSINETVVLHNTDVKFVSSRIKNIHAIYNPTSFPVLPILQEDKKNIIAVVGSTKRYLDKGFDIVIDVWQKIAKSYPTWELHIIGGGSEQNEKILKQKVLEYDIADKVLFTGFVNDVDRRLQAASIFLLPSRVEGFPMVINEAISQGCACAAFSLQGVMNELYSKDAVLISRDGDIDNFTLNLKKMIDNIELRKSLVRNAQCEILKYQSNEIVKNWIKLIEKYRTSLIIH